jgi:hypothetical protein
MSVIDADLEKVAFVVSGDTLRVAPRIGFVTQFDVHDRAHATGQRRSADAVMERFEKSLNDDLKKARWDTSYGHG